MTWVRFKCGCIGIVDGDELPIIVRDCCDERGDLVFTSVPGLAVEDPQPLSGKEVGEIVAGIRDLIRDGYALRHVRRLLAPR